MNENPTQPGVDPAGPPPAEAGPGMPEAGPYGGPRVTGEQIRDVRRLRRSRTDRKVAGVAGGLGRHLDVDPTLIRVAFVVLAFFGGAGFLLYGAVWLLVPEEDSGHAVISTGEETRRILLIVVGVMAVLFVLGQGWGGWWFGPGVPLGLLAIAAVVYLVSRDQNRGQAAPPAYPAQPHPAQPSPPPGTPQSTTAPAYPAPAAPFDPAGPRSGTASFAAAPGGTSTVALPTDRAPGVAAGPAGYGAPPQRRGWAPPYVPPAPRPRRSGPLWFLPTLALISVALGGLGLYDAHHHVDASAYPALALTVTGLMLVLGAFKGRAGGLTLIGIVAALTLAATNVAGALHEAKHVVLEPVTASDISPRYDAGVGELVLDLGKVSDVSALDGRTVRLTGEMAEVEVIVPRDLRVRVDASVETVGGIEIGPDNQSGGFSPSASGTFSGDASSPVLHLDIDVELGHIQVRNSYE